MAKLVFFVRLHNTQPNHLNYPRHSLLPARSIILKRTCALLTAFGSLHEIRIFNTESTNLFYESGYLDEAKKCAKYNMS